MHHVCVKVVLKTSFVTVMMVMLGVSCSSWIPAEGSVVAPFPPSRVHFSVVPDPKRGFKKCGAVSRQGERTYLSEDGRPPVQS